MKSKLPFAFAMRSARTPLLRSLQKAFKLALLSNSSIPLPVDEISHILDDKSQYSRRYFLRALGQAGIMASAGSMMAACQKENVKPVIPTQIDSRARKAGGPNIAIIGGGIAGLNCAYQLKKAGLYATIYEASTRIGGRIYTAKNIMGDGFTTELGGEFIDSGHKDMLNLAKEFGLTLLDMFAPSEQSLIKDDYFFDGQHYTVKQVIEAFAPFVSKIEEDINSLPSVITYNNPAKAIFYDQMSIEGYFNYIGIHGWIRKLLEVAYLTEYGLEVHEQSCINFLWLFSPDTSKGSFDIFGDSDERYKIKGGNAQLTDALNKQVQNQVIADSKLVAINPQGKSYKLSFEKSNGTTSDVVTDMVVLTLPFTLLRQVKLNVPLPSWKLNAIANLGYGTNAKLMLGFQTKVWRAKGYTGYLFADNGLQTGWDNTQLQQGNGGGYTVYLGGKAGVDVGQGTPSAQAVTYLPQLNKIWPGMNTSFKPSLIARMHWPSQPFTQASYACYKVGQYTSIAGAERKSVNGLFFAGEHCSINYQGYMNGAAETGKKAAEEIIAMVAGKKLITQTSGAVTAQVA